MMENTQEVEKLNEELKRLPNIFDGKGMGALFDAPDPRDKVFLEAVPVKAFSELPQVVDLRPQMPPIFDQLELGSCTSQATIGCFWFQQWKQEGTKASKPLSRLQNYYLSRKAQGTINQDSGASVRQAFKNLVDGGCPESVWPYDINKFTQAPSQQCADVCEKWQSLNYFTIPRKLQPGRYDLSLLPGILTCLADGYPIAFSQYLYSSFEPGQNGFIPDPDVNNEEMMGGHAMMIVGYSKKSKTFLLRNSWGEWWGGFQTTNNKGKRVRSWGGYARVSFDHILTHARDLWTFREVELGQ